MNMLLIFIISLTFIGLYLFYHYRKMKNIPEIATSDKIKILTDSNFHKHLRNGLSMVDYWASWCLPCKMMAPVLNEIAEETEGRLNVFKLNVEQFHNLASRASVRNIPTLIMYKNGKEIKRFVGVKSRHFLMTYINELI